LITINDKFASINFISASTGDYYGKLDLKSETSQIFCACFLSLRENRSPFLFVGCRGGLIAWEYDMDSILCNSSQKIFKFKLPLEHIYLKTLVAGRRTLYGLLSRNNRNRGADFISIELNFLKRVMEDGSSNEESKMLCFQVERTYDSFPSILISSTNDMIVIQLDKQVQMFKEIDGAKSRTQFISSIETEEIISLAAVGGRDVALAFKKGIIAVYSDCLKPGKHYISRQLNWHPIAPSCLHFYFNQLFSAGDEAVLVTWSQNAEFIKPTHTLPRLASCPIIGMTVQDNMVGMTTEDGEVVMASTTGLYKWKTSGLPCCVSSTRNLRATSNSIMWAYKNRVYAHKFGRGIASPLIYIPFNYLPTAVEHESQKTPEISCFTRFGGWIALSVLRFNSMGFKVTLQLYHKDTLHSSVPSPHSSSNTIDGIASCSKSIAFATASTGDGMIKIWNKFDVPSNISKKLSWRCTKKFQFCNGKFGDKSLRLDMSEDILCIGLRRCVQVWDQTQGILLRRIPCQANLGLWLKDANILCASSSSIEMWNLFSGRKWGFVSDSQRDSFISSVSWCSDSNNVCIALRDSKCNKVGFLDVVDGRFIPQSVCNVKSSIRELCSIQDNVYAMTNNALYTVGIKQRKQRTTGNFMIGDLKRKVETKVPTLNLPSAQSQDENSLKSKRRQLLSGKRYISDREGDDPPLVSRNFLRLFLMQQS